MSSGQNQSSHAPLKVGDKLGKYDIISQIGAGGTAIVWKGHDKLLDKHAAIKQLLPPESDWENAKERFIEEAETLKRVSRLSKHSVAVLDTINEPRGMFIIMDFVDGQSLEQVLASHPDPMNERQALGIVGGIALALDAIHGAGVIHRDIKPSNILMPKAGGLKVVDFGVAAFVDSQETMSAGTVRYMAPELFGDGKADGRADIYSLGFIAYEMLAGRAKFEEAFRIIMKDQRNAALRWMKWHTNPRVKPTPLNQLNPAISQTLSDLVMRMVEKDPTQRIGSPKELLEAIRRHFAGGDAKPAASATVAASSSAPSPEALGDKTAPIQKRSKLPLILLAALLIVSVTGFGAIVLYKQAREAQAQAARVASAKDRMAALNDRLAALGKRSDEMGAAKIPPTTQQRSDLATDYETLSADYESLAKAWASDTTELIYKYASARSHLALARSGMESGQFKEAQESLDKADMFAIPTLRDQILTLQAEAKRRQAFQEIVTEIRGMIGKQEFSQARVQISEQRRRTLSPEETRLINNLDAQLEDQVYQSQIAQIVAQAKALADAGKQNEAINTLNAAKQKFRSQSIDTLYKQLTKDRDYANALESAKAAESRGEFAKAIEHYTVVLTFKPDPAITEKINVYRSRIALQEGRTARQRGDMTAASTKFQESLNIKFNDEAKRELDEIKSNADRDKLVAEGKEAMKTKDYPTAIAKFEIALQQRDDADLRNAIRTMKVETFHNNAITMLQQGKIASAKEALDEADKLSPGNQFTTKIREALNLRADYERLRDLGDKFRAESNFTEAKAAYGRARDVIKNIQVPETKKEIEARLDDIEFDHLMAQAKAQIANLNWDVAKALLGNASQIRQTSDVTDMLKLVSEKIKARDAAKELQ
jgi:tRNA A-37 threonylcarbamoyl transferase component Bud32/tetratricopeptide (TPR) repeat protein